MKTMDNAVVERQRKARVNRSPEQWHTLVREQRRSGLTVRRFCEQAGASAAAFARWRRHFAGMAEPTTGVFWEAQRVTPSGDRAVAAPVGFVEVAQPARPLDAGVKVRLELGGGIVLELVRV